MSSCFSAFNDTVLRAAFDFLPDALQQILVSVTSLFVGDGWHLTLGALFMVIVIFLPGGLMEGFRRLRLWGGRRFRGGGTGPTGLAPSAAE